MPVQSKRETIQEYILGTTLRLINGLGNYNLDLKTISRSYRMPQETKLFETPAAFILDDTTSQYTPLTANEYTTGTDRMNLTNGFIVGIAGVVHIDHISGLDKRGLLSTELSKMFSDIVIAMLSDITLGGNCLSVVLVSDTRTQSFEETKGTGTIVVLFSIKYDFNPRASIPVT